MYMIYECNNAIVEEDYIEINIYDSFKLFHFFKAKLQNSLCKSVGGIVIFLAPVEDRQLMFSVKIVMTSVQLVYTFLCPSVFRSCY